MAASDPGGPPSGVFVGRVHVLPVRVYYEDTDFTGLVYHAGYLRFLERGRSDYLRLAGVSHAELLARPDPCAFVVTRLEIDYVAPARIDDALEVHTAYDAVSGARMVISQRIRMVISQRILRAGALIVRAAVRAACIAPNGRARRPPNDLVTLLRPRLEAGQTP